jgi:hypothetical protein
MRYGYTMRITCPYCGFTGSALDDFDMSLASECFCPRCPEGDKRFVLSDEDEEDDPLDEDL